jgi:hypothetical protein
MPNTVPCASVRQPTKHDGRSVTRKSSHSFFAFFNSSREMRGKVEGIFVRTPRT